jgi:hypothetical protein
MALTAKRTHLIRADAISGRVFDFVYGSYSNFHWFSKMSSVSLYADFISLSPIFHQLMSNCLWTTRYAY